MIVAGSRQLVFARLPNGAFTENFVAAIFGLDRGNDFSHWFSIHDFTKSFLMEVFPLIKQRIQAQSKSGH